MDRVIEKRIVIHAKPEIVYCALTEAAALGRWLAESAEANAVEGGALSIYFGAGPERKGGRARFLRLVPGRLVRYRWTEEIGPEGTRPVSGDHECQFSIDDNPEGVVVTMTDERSPGPADPERIKTEQRWDEMLVALKALCEGPDAPVAEAPAAAPVVAPRPAARPKRPAAKRPARKPAKKPARRPAKRAARKPARKVARKAARPARAKAARKAPRKAARKGKAPASRRAARAAKKVARKRATRPARKGARKGKK